MGEAMLTIPDDKERLTFVDNLAKSVNKPASQDAYVYATVAAASIQLRLKDEEGAKKKLDECEQILDGFDSVETVVHASFYRAFAESTSRSTSLPPTTRTPCYSSPVSTCKSLNSVSASPAHTI
jgi:hypothetical protein